MGRHRVLDTAIAQRPAIGRLVRGLHAEGKSAERIGKELFREFELDVSHRAVREWLEQHADEPEPVGQ